MTPHDDADISTPFAVHLVRLSNLVCLGLPRSASLYYSVAEFVCPIYLRIRLSLTDRSILEINIINSNECGPSAD